MRSDKEERDLVYNTKQYENWTYGPKMEGQQSEPRRRTREAIRSLRSQGTVFLKKGVVHDMGHTWRVVP